MPNFIGYIVRIDNLPIWSILTLSRDWMSTARKLDQEYKYRRQIFYVKNVCVFYAKFYTLQADTIIEPLILLILQYRKFLTMTNFSRRISCLNFHSTLIDRKNSYWQVFPVWTKLEFCLKGYVILWCNTTK